MNERREAGSGKASRGAFATLFVAIAVFGLMLGLMPATPVGTTNAQEGGAVSANIQLVEDFVAAFNAKDVDKIMSFWGPEPVYHNMPGPPVKGTEAVRGLIESFLTPAENVDWEILHIAESGDTVLAERVDRFVIGGNEVVLPCSGAFDIVDGKIAVWRDYFDMATWQRQMGGQQ